MTTIGLSYSLVKISTKCAPALASAQLYDRYSIHPDAEHQGIFLVIWFGANEEVAGRKRHGIESAQMLKIDIEAKLPAELLGLIDVFVLDVSRH